MALPKGIRNITVEDVDNNIENIYIQGDRIIVHYTKANNIATADDIGAFTSNHWVRIGSTQTTLFIESDGRNVLGKIHLSATSFELIIVPAVTEEPTEEFLFRG